MALTKELVRHMVEMEELVLTEKLVRRRRRLVRAGDV